MTGAGEIEAVSIPFALGIATVTVFIGHMTFAQESIAAGAALVLCVVVLAALIMHNGSVRLVAALYFCTGLFCRLSDSIRISGWSPGAVKRLAASCLESLRSSIAAVPFPHSSTNDLVCALLTGDRSGLTAVQTAAFRDAGASHILALSGLHLGVIYLITSRLLSVTGNSIAARRVRFAIIVLCAGFYTLMTGAGPSVVRAFIFIVLNEAGKLSPERKKTPARTLLVALTIQLAVNPSVISSLGFQLSYLAMAGLMFISPWLKSWYPEGGRLSKLDPMRRIWNGTAATVSCQMLTAPLVWLRFRTFPEYFILANLLALPLTTAIMASSVAAVCLTSIGVHSRLAEYSVDCLVQALLWVLDRISGLPPLSG